MLKYTMFTNSGRRDINEDSIGMTERNGVYCFVLADGLGGHGKGELASQMMVNSICSYFEENGLYDDFLKDAFIYGQRMLAAEKKKLGETSSMLSTCVVLVVSREYVQWAHIGDSRLYMFQSIRKYTRTLDHSVPQMLVMSREISERMIRNHPDRNKLTKACGFLSQTIECTLSERYDTNECMAFLMCTDGFWENVYEKEMRYTLKKSLTTDEWMEKMVKIAADRGRDTNMDNFSAIAVKLCKGK